MSRFCCQCLISMLPRPVYFLSYSTQMRCGSHSTLLSTRCGLLDSSRSASSLPHALHTLFSLRSFSRYPSPCSLFSRPSSTRSPPASPQMGLVSSSQRRKSTAGRDARARPKASQGPKPTLQSKPRSFTPKLPALSPQRHSSPQKPLPPTRQRRSSLSLTSAFHKSASQAHSLPVKATASHPPSPHSRPFFPASNLQKHGLAVFAPSHFGHTQADTPVLRSVPIGRTRIVHQTRQQPQPRSAPIVRPSEHPVGPDVPQSSSSPAKFRIPWGQQQRPRMDAPVPLHAKPSSQQPRQVEPIMAFHRPSRSQPAPPPLGLRASMSAEAATQYRRARPAPAALSVTSSGALPPRSWPDPRKSLPSVPGMSRPRVPTAVNLAASNRSNSSVQTHRGRAPARPGPPDRSLAPLPLRPGPSAGLRAPPQVRNPPRNWPKISLAAYLVAKSGRGPSQMPPAPFQHAATPIVSRKPVRSPSPIIPPPEPQPRRALEPGVPPPSYIPAPQPGKFPPLAAIGKPRSGMPARGRSRPELKLTIPQPITPEPKQQLSVPAPLRPAAYGKIPQPLRQMQHQHANCPPLSAIGTPKGGLRSAGRAPSGPVTLGFKEQTGARPSTIRMGAMSRVGSIAKTPVEPGMPSPRARFPPGWTPEASVRRAGQAGSRIPVQKALSNGKTGWF